MGYLAGQTLTAAMLTRLMGKADPTTDDTFTTSTKVLADDSVTFTAISTHTYKISWSAQHSSSTTSACTMSARYIAGAGPITTTSTQIWQRIMQSSGGNDTFGAFRCVTGLSGLITVGITGLANAGTVTVYGGTVGRELLVEDINP